MSVFILSTLKHSDGITVKLFAISYQRSVLIEFRSMSSTLSFWHAFRRKNVPTYKPVMEISQAKSISSCSVGSLVSAISKKAFSFFSSNILLTGF